MCTAYVHIVNSPLKKVKRSENIQCFQIVGEVHRSVGIGKGKQTVAVYIRPHANPMVVLCIHGCELESCWCEGTGRYSFCRYKGLGKENEPLTGRDDRFRIETGCLEICVNGEIRELHHPHAPLCDLRGIIENISETVWIRLFLVRKECLRDTIVVGSVAFPSPP